MSIMGRARGWGLAVVVAAAGVATTAGAHLQNPTHVPPKRQTDDLAKWNAVAPYLRVIAAYRAGRVDEAVQNVLPWSRTALDEARHTIQDLRDQVLLCRGVKPDIDARAFAGEIEIADLDAAVLLHTDAALEALTDRNGFGTQTQLRAAQSLFDWTRRRDRELHDRPNEQLALDTWCHPPPALEHRDWHLAVAWALLFHWEIDLADGFATLGLEAASQDPEMLLAAATIKEALAIDAAQFPGKPPEMPGWWEARGVKRDRRNAAKSLDQALALYRRALAVRPVYIQTRLRLGRVLSQLGQLDEARTELELVAAHADEAPERYLAELFLARVAEQAEDGDAAIAHYRQALDAWPVSQAARIGLVHALGLAEVDARAPPLLAELLAQPWPQPVVVDPWWAYPFGETERGFRLLDELRGRFVETP